VVQPVILGRVAIEPDTKDWTWVVDRRCPECGFEAGAVSTDDLPALIEENAAAWRPVLDAPGCGARPSPGVWSPLEYACHVRDVHRVFAGRLADMLEHEDPRLESWDQDRAAVEGRYGAQQPTVVLEELLAAAHEAATGYAGVSGARWDRTGRRADGAVFTAASMGRYQLHDVVHHLWDVTR
jgi:hypothetical protein